MRYMICTVEYRQDGLPRVIVNDNIFDYQIIKWNILDSRLVDDDILTGFRKYAMDYLKMMEHEGDMRLVGKEEWPILIVLQDKKKNIPVYYYISCEWRA